MMKDKLFSDAERRKVQEARASEEYLRERARQLEKEEDRKKKEMKMKELATK